MPAREPFVPPSTNTSQPANRYQRIIPRRFARDYSLMLIRRRAVLFSRDVKTIGKHINNALKEELDNEPVVAKFATTAADGKIYQVEYFSLEMITSVGYRVKSKRGVKFRRWSNKVLKQYLLKGYAVN